jgi:hypothetical protein
MGLSLSTVIKVIIQYIGTGGLGGIPLMPNLGIKVQGMPPMTAATPGGLSGIGGLAAMGLAGLGGNLAGLSSLAGSLGGLSSLTSSLGGLSGIAGSLGSLSGIAGLAGNLSGISSIAGNLTGLSSLSSLGGNLAGLSGLAGNLGNLSNVSGLAGQLGGISSIAGNLSGLAGVSNLASSLGGISNLAGNLGGIANLTSSLSGISNLTTGLGGISSLAGISNLTGSLGSIAGSVSGLTGLSGLAGIAGNLNSLSGNLTSLSGIGGNLGNLANLSGNLSNLSSLSGNLGGVFTNLSGITQTALAGQFNNVIADAGLNAANPFMNSPLGNVVSDINGTLTGAVSSLNVASSLGLDASVGQFTTAMDLVKSTTDQLAGHPLNLVTGLTNTENLVVSAGAQVLSPTALLGNLSGTIAHAPDIAQVTKQALSSDIFNAAQTDINTINSQIAAAVTQTDRDLLGGQLKTKLDSYTTQLQQQSTQFEDAAARISSNINATSLMAAKVAPAGANLSAGLALLGQAYLTPNLKPDQLAAIATLSQNWADVVEPTFVDQVLPTLAEQAGLEANTTKTALTKLANASTNVIFNKGYPEGVNVRYG